MIAISLLPPLLFSFASDVLLIVTCCLALRYKVIRPAAILFLASTTLDVLSFVDLLHSEVKDFGVHIPVMAWMRLPKETIEPINIFSESLNIGGLAWLLLIVLRYGFHRKGYSHAGDVQEVSQG